ncbi:hypothetical protein [Anaerolentibacter hominis]|uniref:hypothetical protein n=1 Tax=Anaerolentibacter hominis TaxID=3079009 RepID=UPI0031B81A95
MKIKYTISILLIFCCILFLNRNGTDVISVTWHKDREAKDDILDEWMEKDSDSTLVISVIQPQEDSSSDREAIARRDGVYYYQDAHVSETWPHLLRISEPACDDHTYYVLSQSAELDYPTLWNTMWELPENRADAFRVIFWTGRPEANYPQIYDGLEAEHLMEAKVLSGIDALPPFMQEQSEAYRPYYFLSNASEPNNQAGIASWNHMLECGAKNKSARFYLLDVKGNILKKLYYSGERYYYIDPESADHYSNYHFKAVLADRDFMGEASVRFYLCESNEYISTHSFHNRPSILLLTISSRELDERWVRYGTFAPNPLYYDWL